MIKVIIFDQGGVLLTNDWPEPEASFIKHFEVTHSDLQASFDKHWPKYKIGRTSEEEFARALLADAGAQAADIDLAKSLWREAQKEVEDMLSLVSKLKKKYTVALFCNIGKGLLQFKRNKFELDSYFDIIVASCNEGLAKPDPEFYQILLNRLEIAPKQCVFIDDKERNLIPARALGIKTILFKGQSALEKELNAIGII